jgi:hypothetical protein
VNEEPVEPVVECLDPPIPSAQDQDMMIHVADEFFPNESEPDCEPDRSIDNSQQRSSIHLYQ